MTDTMSQGTFALLARQGVGLYDQERYQEALPLLQAAYKGRPGEAAVVKLLASVHQLLGQKRQARDLYRQALKIDPDQTDVLTNLGEILIAELAYDEALAHLQRSIDLDPNYEDSSSQRARALIMHVASDLEEA